MKRLYLECYSGISGDMTVAALLDLGADRQVLEAGLGSMGVDGYTLTFGRANKCGIDAYDFDVLLEDTPGEGAHEHGHDHAHEHSHGHGHAGAHGHSHEHGHSHDHAREQGCPHAHGCEDGHIHTHPHTHGHVHDHPHPHEGAQPHEHSHGQGHGHVHRNLADVTALIRSAQISPRAKEMALAIFERVARAEAKVHGKPLEEVHFHEVGAIDSIVDIVGTAICLDNLDVQEVYCSTLYEGAGYTRCQHGVIPVPAPATLEIVRAASIPLRITETKGEMVTPTGAAIVAALSKGFALPAGAVIQKVGIGAGKKEMEHANILRAMLFTLPPQPEEVWELSCNIDDSTGEMLGYAMEQLLSAGANDVFFTPIYMKKNRPACLLSVICQGEKREEMARLLLRHTSTIGVRMQRLERRVMERTMQTVQTPLGAVQVKRCVYGDIVRQTVEYESAKELAKRNNLPINEVYRITQSILNA